MNTRTLLICSILAALSVPACSKQTSHKSGGASVPKKVLFYRNPMNPAVTSPVPAKDGMGMDYIPVYEENNEGGASAPDRATIHMSSEVEQRIGVTVAMVSKHDLSVSIHASAQVAYDPQLYSALLEHREAMAFLEKARQGKSPDILEEAQATVRSSELRLRQMGLSVSQIDEMSRSGRDLSNLLLGSQGKNVWVYANIYDYETSMVHPGEAVELSSPALPGETFRGTVRTIDTLLNNETRTVRVRVSVPDPQRHLKPEMYLDAVLKARGGRKLSVPTDAVIDTGERQLVYVQKEPGTYEARDVKLGLKADGYEEIVSGLKEGEKVAISANFLIDSESRIQAATNEAAKQLK